MTAAPIRVNVAQLGMVVVSTVLALLCTAYLGVSILEIAWLPECVAFHPAALHGHRVALALTAGAVVSLWMTAGWLLIATRRHPATVVAALVAVAVVVALGSPLGHGLADRWSGGDTDRAACGSSG